MNNMADNKQHRSIIRIYIFQKGVALLSNGQQVTHQWWIHIVIIKYTHTGYEY